jgi:hypothetical protein
MNEQSKRSKYRRNVIFWKIKLHAYVSNWRKGVINRSWKRNSLFMENSTEKI